MSITFRSCASAMGASLVLVGCAGSSITPVQAGPSLYAGHYVGRWNEPTGFGTAPLVAGTMDMTVAMNGVVTGTYTQTKPIKSSGALNGTVNNNGKLSFDVSFPGRTEHFDGQIQNGGTHLQGFFGDPMVGYVNFPQFDLVKE